MMKEKSVCERQAGDEALDLLKGMVYMWRAGEEAGGYFEVELCMWRAGKGIFQGWSECAVRRRGARTFEALFVCGAWEKSARTFCGGGVQGVRKIRRCKCTCVVECTRLKIDKESAGVRRSGYCGGGRRGLPFTFAVSVVVCGLE